MDLEVPDNLDTDIGERPDMSDTQREDWLLQTEPLHGARPRERPPVINDRSGGLDLEAAGVWGGAENGSKRNPGPSAASRTTYLTGRGGDDTTEGGGRVRPPSIRVHHIGGGGAPGPWASGFPKRGASRASDFFRGPSTGWWSGPTEGG